jgi:hypothetical protein
LLINMNRKVLTFQNHSAGWTLSTACLGLGKGISGQWIRMMVKQSNGPAKGARLVPGLHPGMRPCAPGGKRSLGHLTKTADGVPVSSEVGRQAGWLGVGRLGT